MADPIHELYEHHTYPPMSHPVADPAVSAVAARLAGLPVPHPRGARILEIGCCSGHHLLPLALRWPESTLTGIDLAASSIREARERAATAGLANVDFQVADLLDFEPRNGPFDYIIAHGFFSWVPAPVKTALLEFCRRHLSAHGIATVSFNLEAGWRLRFPVIAKVLAIRQAGGGGLIESLQILRTVADEGEVAIIDDMLAKGPAILAFDDFGPVNDAWPLDRFAQAAAAAGLRWLGESDPTANRPPGLSAEVFQALASQALDPLDFQMALDEAAGRTFRSGLLCRDDAAVAARVPVELVAGFSACDPAGASPACLPLTGPARKAFEDISAGRIQPRIEPVDFTGAVPEFPKLDAFRLLCARRGLPIVDVWHRPCSFPAPHFEVLAQMDGGTNRAALAAFAARHCPELAFEPWLAHLAWRGFFFGT